MAKYEIIIWWSKEDNCYLAEVPELPGCMADGESLSAVTTEIEEAIRNGKISHAHRSVGLTQ